VKRLLLLVLLVGATVAANGQTPGGSWTTVSIDGPRTSMRDFRMMTDIGELRADEAVFNNDTARWEFSGNVTITLSKDQAASLTNYRKRLGLQP
jgi:hypothetical protein